MRKENFFYYAGLFCAVSLIITCFVPWVHYNSINETFTGYRVTKFVTGVYYGKPGVYITAFASIIIAFSLWKNDNAKKANLFIAAVLFAYTIRTYILFTGAMFEGEVTKLAGIYLIVLLAALLLVCSAFPRRSRA